MPYWTFYRRSHQDPGAAGAWVEASGDELGALRDRLGPLLTAIVEPDPGARVLRIALPFYPGHTLYEFVDVSKTPRLPDYVVAGPGGIWPLDWTNQPIYRLNASGALAIDAANVADYLRFYLAHVAGRHDRFVPHESDDAITRGDLSTAQRDTLNQHATALVPSVDDDGNFHFDSVMRFAGALVASHLTVSPDGTIAIGQEKMLAEELPIEHDTATDSPRAEATPFDMVDGWLTLAQLDPVLRGKLKGLADIADSDELRDVDLRFMPLGFFTQVVLTRVAGPGPATGFGLYGLWSAEGLHLLRGRSKDIYEAIARETFQLDDTNVRDYLQFFCNFVHSDEGPFRIVSRQSDLNVTAGPSRRSGLPRDSLPVAYNDLSSDALDFFLRVPTAGPALHDKAPWPMRALVQYAGNISLARFMVARDGSIEMRDDTNVIDELPIDKRIDKMLLPDVVANTIDKAQELSELVSAAARRSNWPAYLNERELESSVLRECVRVQLVRALRAGGGAPLFAAPTGADDDELLVAFANFLFDVNPVVIIESRTTYIERVVSALLVDRVEHSPKFKTVGASPYSNGEGMVQNLQAGDFWQISMHEWYTLRRPEAIAHKLGTTNSITVIGCDAQSAVPEPLRRVTDVVIVLDNLDEELFRTTFCRLFNCEWPAQDDDGGLWQRYVGPGDFYQPLREMLGKRRDDQADSGWQPGDAIAAIRERVVDRLSPIGASDGPALDEVHGLGEARQVLVDLIADIRDAVNEKISWNAMDRGLLLVGEPGTGKTMLARAMARDCGVRFIQASEARWMAGSEHLGQHIREIRATFAEAKRYAPSILFIDELDSIGNRELFQGKNRQYCVEIVNALLQELEGVYGREGVFVIGATNYLERVDPALTRAGRLDQVVRVRRPDRAALGKILEFHLRKARADGRVDKDVDRHALAALANGATGADIELFVRDAARRARKEGSATIAQRHLAAAITRAPRDMRSTRAVSPGERERTAVHEAGHAVAMLLCQHYPARLNMISIIPRSDGSLGFTGFIPDERNVFTRREFDEYLQVLLGGRAAEEIEYGRNGISSGAGGSSSRNDLALATNLAAQLVCQLGMGEGATLRWRARASDPAEIAAVGKHLDDAYQSVLAALTAQRPLLDDLRDCLLDRHEVFAADLYALATKHGLGLADKEDARA